MSGATEYVVKALLGLGVLGIPAVLFLFFPERLYAALALLLKPLRLVPPLRIWAGRQWTKYRLQARLRRGLRALDKAPPWSARKIRIQWVTPAATEARAFVAKDKVVVCLKADDARDQNSARAAGFFVSVSLLRRAKQYLSALQREALDLFVTAKLLEQVPGTAEDEWVEGHVLPALERHDELNAYLTTFETAHRGGFFFPVALRELEFLGHKVYGRARIEALPTEVDAFFEAVRRTAARRQKEESDLTFSRTYIRMGIVIVGRPEKVDEDGSRYVEYIHGALVGRGIESIYLLATTKNARVLTRIADQIPGYAIAHRLTDSTRYGDGTPLERAFCLLRSEAASVFEPRSGEWQPRLPEAKVPVGRVKGTVVRAPEHPYAFGDFDEGFDGVLVPYSQVNGWIDRLLPGDELEADLITGPEGVVAHNVRIEVHAPGARPPLTREERLTQDEADEYPMGALPDGWLDAKVVKASAGATYAFASVSGVDRDVFVPFSVFDEWIDELELGADLRIQLEHGAPDAPLRAQAAAISTVGTEVGETSASVHESPAGDLAQLSATERPGAATSVSGGDHIDPSVWHEGIVVRAGSRKFVFVEFPGVERPIFVPFAAFSEWISHLYEGTTVRARIEVGDDGRPRGAEAEVVRD